MELNNVRAAILVEQQYQEMEVWYPLYRLREAGCKVTVVGPESGHTYPSKLGYPVKSDRAARDVSAADFDVLVIPGGFAPDYLRRSEAVLRLVSGMAEQGKVILVAAGPAYLLVLLGARIEIGPGSMEIRSAARYIEKQAELMLT